MNRARLSFCLVLAACTVPPRFESRVPLGTARSDEPELAVRLADTGNQLAPAICAWLRVEPAPPFVIWHVPRVEAADFLVERDRDGAILSRRIEIGDFMARRQTRFAVGHELVHWYARGVWDRLPHAVEEGLADELALRCSEELRGVRAMEFTAALASLTPERRARALALDERSWKDVSAEACSDAYAVGFEIVQRVGVDNLRALCERAENEGVERVPSAWLDAPSPTDTAPNPWKLRVDLRTGAAAARPH